LNDIFLLMAILRKDWKQNMALMELEI